MDPHEKTGRHLKLGVIRCSWDQEIKYLNMRSYRFPGVFTTHSLVRLGTIRRWFIFGIQEININKMVGVHHSYDSQWLGR